ncbi:hypothetical protein [Rufibacter roseus]|uniref:GAF domain-containing protein n=1 Tax=Rufibacter roseus TaxID=1567108 RepID=A0ABW2DN30_9BACT|nr:hypothetical protein [Rufibacter roseus]
MADFPVDEEHLKSDFNKFSELLKEQGLEGALHFLGSRTPHRFTGIYKYTGNILTNIALFDSLAGKLVKGENFPMKATYCALVQHEPSKSLEFNDVTTDERLKGKVNSPVISYCGVLISDEYEQPFGTLCHFDMNRCQERSYDIPLLKSAAKLLYQHLSSQTN